MPFVFFCGYILGVNLKILQENEDSTILGTSRSMIQDIQVSCKQSLNFKRTLFENNLSMLLLFNSIFFFLFFDMSSSTFGYTLSLCYEEISKKIVLYVQSLRC